MKKFLTVTLAFIIFVTFSTTANARPNQIFINSEEELLKMREMAEADGRELTPYLVRTGFYDNGLRYRADVVAFLELLDSLPIPFIPGMIFTNVTYFPGRELFIILVTETRERYCYSFFLTKDKGMSRVEEQQLVEIHRINDNGRQIIIYSPDMSIFPSEHGLYFFPMQIDGYFVQGFYNLPGGERMPDMSPQKMFEEIFDDTTITSLRDLTWIERNIKGDIFDEGFVTTANALEILRFVVGLENDIWGRTSAMAAADVNGDGVIDAADALEILRYVVGLPNAITGY
jgi:hypothetical protein